MIPVEGGMLPQTSGVLAGHQRSVTLSVESFQIEMYEVTWGKWKEVRDWAITNGYSDLAGVGGTYPDGAADNTPVCYVNWYDVVKWSNARSEKEGLPPVYRVGEAIYRTGEIDPTVNKSAGGYRLPTEPEWEWAAGGGVYSRGHQYSGSSYGNLDLVMSSFIGGLQTVGSKFSNELRIHDMTGNVSEWCEDVYTEPYGVLFNEIPVYHNTGFTSIRGGPSGNPWPLNFRSFRSAISREVSLGFRLARSSGQ